MVVCSRYVRNVSSIYIVIHVRLLSFLVITFSFRFLLFNNVKVVSFRVCVRLEAPCACELYLFLLGLYIKY